MGIGGGAAFDDIREQASDENFNRGTWAPMRPRRLRFPRAGRRSNLVRNR